MKYYIGIDLGTSSVRALLINSDGTQIAVEGAQYDVLIPRQGYAEQDAENWYVQTAQCIRKVIAVSGIDPSDVAALSFSGQMHGLVALNAQGKPVANAIIWLDQRSGDAIEEIYARLGRDWVTAHTQIAIATGFLIASLYWMKT
ncbi:MAG: FGGY family carbohydrate kinase, partial [Clostridia bacterium]